MEPYLPPPDGRFASILVPSVDTVRAHWLLHSSLATGRPVLFVGESGDVPLACVLLAWTPPKAVF